MEKLLDALKFYKKQCIDLEKAIKKSVSNYKYVTPKMQSALSRRVSICSEAKEKAFWYCVGIFLESEFYKATKDVNSSYVLENIKNSLGRYPSYFQSLNGEHLK